MQVQNQVGYYDSGINVSVAGGTDVVVPLFRFVMCELRKHGFYVAKDPQIERDHKILSQFHRQISKPTPQGVLYISAHHFPAGMRFEGWQSVVFDNPNGGQYDFNKLAKMPYQIRLTWLKFRNLIESWMVQRGFTVEPPKPEWKEDPLKAFNSDWGVTRFRRDADGWPDESELRLWSQVDADGVRIRNGEYRYVQHGSGRWFRVRVYGGINGMWRGVSGCDHIQAAAQSYRSHVTLDDLRRRSFLVRHVIDKLLNVYVKSLNDRNYNRAEGIVKILESYGYSPKVQFVPTKLKAT